MKALIYTNPTTREIHWRVADVVVDMTIEQYCRAVCLDTGDGESHKPENYHWVEQPEGVSRKTHEYKDGKFVERRDKIFGSVNNG